MASPQLLETSVWSESGCEDRMLDHSAIRESGPLFAQSSSEDHQLSIQLIVLNQVFPIYFIYLLLPFSSTVSDHNPIFLVPLTTA